MYRIFMTSNNEAQSYERKERGKKLNLIGNQIKSNSKFVNFIDGRPIFVKRKFLSCGRSKVCLLNLRPTYVLRIPDENIALRTSECMTFFLSKSWSTI